MQEMNGLFRRQQLESQIFAGLRAAPIVALLGPRQAGKTSLVRVLSVPDASYFDLEDDISLARLEGGPQSTLDRLRGTIVIDEIQRRPELFTSLRVLADRPGELAKFLILGSASPALLRNASDSLAGRIHFIDMGGFHFGELPEGAWQSDWRKLWVRGGFPRSLLSPDSELSSRWRLNYLRALAERDLRDLAETHLSGDQIRRLLLLIAHHHGQAWNHTAVGKTLGMSSKTVLRHMELLKGAFIIRELRPFYANVSKRLRKASRYYFRDSGLLHALLGIKEAVSLETHPACGASWEGFCIEQLMRLCDLDESKCGCYSVQSGTEMDLIVETSAGLVGFEFKSTSAPSRTRSMTEAIRDLGLKQVFVIYPGKRRYRLDDLIDVVPLNLLGDLREWVL